MGRVGCAINGGHIHTYEVHTAIDQELSGIRGQAWMIGKIARILPFRRPTCIQYGGVRAERRAESSLDMLAPDLALGAYAAHVDQARWSRAAIKPYAVDGVRIVEEMKRGVHVGACVDAERDAAQVRSLPVENGDPHGAVSREDRRTGADRLAEVDDASGVHAISDMLMDGATMRKVMHFDSPREHYHCDAAVVWCYDHRFEPVLRKLLKRMGAVHFDLIRLAGGAKCLATPEPASERELVLEQIRKSVRLHGTDRVVLMVHSDCGAYGGLAAFRGDVQAEVRHHGEELRRAAECVRQAIPEVAVACYHVDFEGVWTEDPDPA